MLAVSESVPRRGLRIAAALRRLPNDAFRRVLLMPSMRAGLPKEWLGCRRNGPGCVVCRPLGLFGVFDELRCRDGRVARAHCASDCLPQPSPSQAEQNEIPESSSAARREESSFPAFLAPETYFCEHSEPLGLQDKPLPSSSSIIRSNRRHTAPVRTNTANRRSERLPSYDRAHVARSAAPWLAHLGRKSAAGGRLQNSNS